MAFGDADLTMILADAFKVSVSYTVNSQKQTGWGILDRSDGFSAIGADVQLGVRTTTLDLATDAFTDLASDASIVVDGTTYLIREEPALVDDGRITRLVLVTA